MSAMALKKCCLDKVETVINKNHGIRNCDIARQLNWVFSKQYFTWELTKELVKLNRVSKTGCKYYPSV